ncbi:unnamed protein product [Prunus armeniaca]
MGKQSIIAFKQQDKEGGSTRVLDYIHANVWGLSQEGLGLFIKEKSKVFTKFKEWMAEVKNLTKKKIKILRSDNGGEYKDNKFLEFCRNEGIKRHFTLKKVPQQNGAAEMMNRTLMTHERCMRIHVGLPEPFWAESVNHDAYLVFGYNAYALIPTNEISKLKPKSLECIFIGFESGVKGYKLWDPVNQKKILSKDVVFDEKTMPINKVKNSEVKEDIVEKETTIEVPLKRVFRETSQEQPTEDVKKEVASDIEEEDAGQQQQQTQEEEEAQA